MNLSQKEKATPETSLQDIYSKTFIN